jgi:hypothetical protein
MGIQSGRLESVAAARTVAELEQLMEGGSVTLVLDELYEVRQADSELSAQGFRSTWGS